jgi:hypothetical protein
MTVRRLLGAMAMGLALWALVAVIIWLTIGVLR